MSLALRHVTCYTGYMTSDWSFEFIAGSPALCLVDTLGNRGGEGRERLTDPLALHAWLEMASLCAEGLRRPDEVQLSQARLLREAIHRCARSVVNGKAPARTDLDVLNRAAALPPLRPQLKRGVIIQVAAHPVEAAFSVLAADALQILAPPQRERVRQCPDCAMIFLDTSRPGRRRWCSSTRGCGNRAKVRNLRARRAAIQEDC